MATTSAGETPRDPDLTWVVRWRASDAGRTYWIPIDLRRLAEKRAIRAANERIRQAGR